MTDADMTDSHVRHPVPDRPQDAPVHAALFLVLAFFTASAHWLLLQSEFLADRKSVV